MNHAKTTALILWVVLVFIFVPGGIAIAAETEDQLRLLQQQNEALQRQLNQQQKTIDALVRQVREIQNSNANSSEESAPAQDDFERKSASGFSLGKVQISGEGGVGLFETGSNGRFPNSEFRVDEAKLFVDAPVWGNVYGFAELNLAQQEGDDVTLELGELYLDVEDISELWGRSGQLSLRLGRLDIPFGEEYQWRDDIDNPLISHSLTDFWGVDEGVELYGSAGKFSYVVAAQNGGLSDVRDFNADKSISGRLSFDPKPWLHLSVSGMRTGDLSRHGDKLSALWFAGGFFHSIGSAETKTFHANLAQADIEFRLPRGNIKTFGGYIRYDDNDPSANNGRDIYYYSVEGIYNFTRKLYGGARFSQIFARKGFPIVGNGEMDHYLFNNLTDGLWRCSVGLGYRWNSHLVVKTEYSFEQGKEVGGAKRDHQDMVATEAAFGF
ncbi:MAG TPA: hypothetical protein VFM25_13185 [Verrucomicrobiae bacterium]|nr:hypothetical protein [Verrucomicrobiae bacterium]